MSRHAHVDPTFASLLDALSPRYVQLERDRLAAADDTPEPAPANEPRPLRQDEE